MMKKILLTCLVLIVITGCKQATVGHDAAYEEAISYIGEYKFDEAYEKMIVLANSGHAKAQYHIGCIITGMVLNRILKPLFLGIENQLNQATLLLCRSLLLPMPMVN